MKKLINLSFIYALAAMASGVFYREFTKYLEFTGRTSLAFTHLHLFTLGTMVLLILALFSLHTDLMEQKCFKTFLVLYNIGLPLMVVMFYVRGILQALEAGLSAGLNAAISGVSGISHIILGVAIVLLFLCLKNAKQRSVNAEAQ